MKCISTCATYSKYSSFVWFTNCSGVSCKEQSIYCTHYKSNGNIYCIPTVSSLHSHSRLFIFSFNLHKILFYLVHHIFLFKNRRETFQSSISWFICSSGRQNGRIVCVSLIHNFSIKKDLHNMECPKMSECSLSWRCVRKLYVHSWVRWSSLYFVKSGSTLLTSVLHVRPFWCSYQAQPPSC